MTPIEAMARALEPEAWSDVPVPSITRIAWKMRREESMEAARAALTALRDCGVTEGMFNAWTDDVPLQGNVRGIANVVFRAMLDAALGE